MKQETRLEYIAPDADAVKVNVLEFFCDSAGSTEQLEEEDLSNFIW